jgi:hypothetical protein
MREELAKAEPFPGESMFEGVCVEARTTGSIDGLLVDVS